MHIFGDACAAQICQCGSLDAFHGSVDFHQRLRPFVHGQIHQVDINGETRQVSHKQIDRRTAL